MVERMRTTYVTKEGVVSSTTVTPNHRTGNGAGRALDVMIEVLWSLQEIVHQDRDSVVEKMSS